jgi:hypothetical protein
VTCGFKDAAQAFARRTVIVDDEQSCGGCSIDERAIRINQYRESKWVQTSKSEAGAAWALTLERHKAGQKRWS